MNEDLEKVETIETLFKILSFLKKSSFLFFSFFFLLEKQRSSPLKGRNLNFAQFLGMDEDLEKVETIENFVQDSLFP